MQSTETQDEIQAHYGISITFTMLAPTPRLTLVPSEWTSLTLTMAELASSGHVHTVYIQYMDRRADLFANEPQLQIHYMAETWLYTSLRPITVQLPSLDVTKSDPIILYSFESFSCNNLTFFCNDMRYCCFMLTPHYLCLLGESCVNYVVVYLGYIPGSHI
jgi:hypothetical protein